MLSDLDFSKTRESVSYLRIVFKVFDGLIDSGLRIGELFADVFELPFERWQSADGAGHYNLDDIDVISSLISGSLLIAQSSARSSHSLSIFSKMWRVTLGTDFATS